MPVDNASKNDLEEGNSRQGVRSYTSCHLQRIKQIAYGKNTVGYQNYIMLIPKQFCLDTLICREARGPDDPQTPDADEPISKRRFEGKVRIEFGM